MRGGVPPGSARGGPAVQRAGHQPHPRPAALVRPDARACLRRVYGEASPDVHALLTVAADGLAARQWRDMGARTQEEARSFIVSSLRRRLWASSSAASLHATASAGCRTSACRGPSSSGACSAATAHRWTAGASAALRAVRRLLPVPGRRGTAGRPRVSAHGRRACRKVRGSRAQGGRGARARRRSYGLLSLTDRVIELHAASVPHTDL